MSWQLGTWDLLDSHVPNKINVTTLESHLNHVHDLPHGMEQVIVVDIFTTEGTLYVVQIYECGLMTG